MLSRQVVGGWMGRWTTPGWVYLCAARGGLHAPVLQRVPHQAHGPNSRMAGLVSSSPFPAALMAPCRVWAHSDLNSSMMLPDLCFFSFALCSSTALHSAHDGGWPELWMLPVRHLAFHQRTGDWCYRHGGLLRVLWQSSEESGLCSQPLCR